MNNDQEETGYSADEMRRRNEQYLGIFEEDLIQKGLNVKTIKKHVSNADLLINEYLLWDDVYRMEDGVYMILSFFSWFNQKCLWATPNSAKGLAASIKKFYKSMMEHELISKEDYEFLKDDIREGLPEWTVGT